MSNRIGQSGIYSILNTLDGTVYVGRAGNIAVRWGDHRKLLRGGRHENTHLQRAWNRDGEDAFTFSILEEVSDLATMNEREEYWFSVYPKRYNILPNAGTMRGYTRPPEDCANISKGRKGIPRPVTSEAHRQHLSEALKGRTPSQATIDAARAALTGKPLSAEHKVSAGLVGKKRPPRTPEQIERYRQAALRRMADPARRQHLSDTLKAKGIAPSMEARLKGAQARRPASTARHCSPDAL